MSAQRVTFPPLVAHSPDNKGATVVVVTYSFMFITILFAILRTWSSYAQKRALKWDDLSFCLAVLFIIPESIVTEHAAGNGLGQHLRSISTAELERYYKYIYASQVLGIIIQFLAKFSVVLMIERIVEELATKKSSLVIKLTVTAWFLFSFFTVAFQCSISRPWEFTKANCTAEGRLYYVIIVGTIATDAFLGCYFIPVIWKLQMRRSLRFLVSSLFAVRLIVCGVSIPYLALLPGYLSSDDKTWDNANFQIFHQVVINLSVTTAGILSVRRFLSELQTGKLGMVLNDREIEMTNTSRSKKQSDNATDKDSSQTSGIFSRKRWGRNHTEHSHTQPNISVFTNTNNLRLRPDETARFTTHVVGNSSSGSATGSRTETDARKRNTNVGDALKGDDEIGDDKSTTSLKKNGVYQQRDFELHVEYEGHDGESR